MIGGASVGQRGSPELPTLERRAHMQLDGSRGVILIASTALPQLGQLIGQADTAAVLQDHRAKAPQQLDRHIVGRLDDHGAHLLQHRMQKRRTLRGEALVDSGVAHADVTYFGPRG